MKIFYLVRHAKSSWDNPTIRDFDRPLNDRGFQAAKDMSHLFAKNNATPELLVSSPAKRAFTTATYFSDAMGINETEIVKNENIYEASSEALIHIIQATSEAVSSVIFFGHNPAFTEVSNYFSSRYIDNVPTCGIFCFRSEAATWAKISPDNTVLTDYHLPKRNLQ